MHCLSVILSSIEIDAVVLILRAYFQMDRQI
jgi:hypothetical protein